ncbi:MAG: hypothetical protein AB1725_08130, partial [Armatimonadota bacterium]
TESSRAGTPTRMERTTRETAPEKPQPAPERASTDGNSLPPGTAPATGVPRPARQDGASAQADDLDVPAFIRKHKQQREDS